MGMGVRLLLLSFCLLGNLQGLGADTLLWRHDQARVDAEIGSWTLPQLLEKISSVTGWEVYLEPETSHAVSAKFKDLPPNEALRLLLGKLNYAVLPQSNSVPKLFVFRTTLQDATQRIRAPNSKLKEKGDVVPNELVVTLKPGGNIEDLARQLGAKIVGRNDELNTYRLRFEDAAATRSARDQLEGNNSVASVDSNYYMERPTTTDPLSLSSTAPFTLKPKVVGDANYIIVGLVDSPVQKLGGGMDEFLLPGLAVAGDSSPNDNAPTHGTSMSETILRGLAWLQDSADGSKVRILPVDVYGTHQATTTYDVAEGIYRAIKGGATIINLSLGSEGDSRFLHSVIQSAYKQGALFVAAAGNEPVSTPTYPAAYSEVIAVTAGDRKGNVASYANRGEFVDVVAPSSSIVNFRNKTYYVSGTSASTAYVAGMAAGLADTTGKNLSQVGESIRETLAKPQSETQSKH